MSDHSTIDVEQDTIDTPSIVLVGIFAALVCFVLILGVQVLYYRMEATDEYKKVVLPGSTPLKEMVSEQQGSLGTYRWIDRNSDTVAIPIERAMQLTVHDLGSTHP
jgi:hypothetical protein